MTASGEGIDISNAGHNEISYSEVRDGPRCGVIIHIGTTMSGNFTYAKSNDIKNVKIVNVGQDSGDMGYLYFFSFGRGGAFSSNKLEQILIFVGESDPSVTDIIPYGVFADSQTSYQIFENVQVIAPPNRLYRTFDASPPHEFKNVSWLPGFDQSLMDKKNIGLKSDFPQEYLPREKR